jgi:hypothetical protein
LAEFAYLGEVTHLIALATLNVLGGSGLGALLRVVAGLLAVLASEGVDTLLGTVAGPVTWLLAVDTGDGWCSVLALNSLLFAILPNVTEFCGNTS